MVINGQIKRVDRPHCYFLNIGQVHWPRANLTLNPMRQELCVSAKYLVGVPTQ